jgi:hypothetical protein
MNDEISDRLTIINSSKKPSIFVSFSHIWKKITQLAGRRYLLRFFHKLI